MMDLDNIPDTQTEAEELEEVVMGLIINSGQARSLAYAALKQAKQGDFAAAKAMMDQSRMALNEAHLVQTKLIEGDAGEGKMKVSLVLVHAQDHLISHLDVGDICGQSCDKPCGAEFVNIGERECLDIFIHCLS